MANKSLKSRINKFIFQDGKVFLRLKTHAKDLKVQKNTDTGKPDYQMLIPTHSSEGNFTAIPVLWINEFTVEKEAQALDLSSDDMQKAISMTKEKWGELTILKDFKSDVNYYYIAPSDKSYAVKVGPIHKGVDGTKIEIDWANLQWSDERA